MMKRLISVLTLLVCVTALAVRAEEDTKIQDALTDRNFWTVVKKEPIYFVKFYLSTCPHCIRLAPTWERVAKALKGIVPLGEVDARANQQMSQEFHVSGVPAMFLLRKVDGKTDPERISYTGDRSFADLVSFVTKHLPIRDLDVSERAQWMRVTETLPFRALLIEEADSVHDGESEARTVFAKMHAQKASQFLFGRVLLSSKSEVESIKKVYNLVTKLPALVVTQIDSVVDILEGDATDKDQVEKFFAHLGERQERVQEEEKPHVSHTTFTVTFALLCIVGIVGCVVFQRTRTPGVTHKHNA